MTVVGRGPTGPVAGVELLTVGHGTLAADELAALLVDHGAAHLVDVRSYPGSRRHPQFGRDAMASWLPEAGVAYSWERRLVDLNVRPLRSSDIEWADIIFATAMLVQKESLRRVVEQCRARGKRVVIGGPYVTTSVEDLPAADHFFLGEAETTFPEFLLDLERGQARRCYQAAERPPLSAAPIPDFRLADIKRYSAMSVQYSRGCPFQCEFCDIIEIYGRVPRTKSSEQLLAELDALLAVGCRGTVFIVDDNFIGNKRNVKRLLPALADWQERHGRPFAFLTEASVNLAEDDELLDGMRRAGFRRVFLGIETPVEQSLKEARKSQNTRTDLLDSVRKIQSRGLEVMGGFIIGFDADPADIFERQNDFIRDSAIQDVRFVQYPGHRDRSEEISLWTMPVLISEALVWQNYDVDIVASATFTSMAFQTALYDVIQQANTK